MRGVAETKIGRSKKHRNPARLHSYYDAIGSDVTDSMSCIASHRWRTIAIIAAVSGVPVQARAEEIALVSGGVVRLYKRTPRVLNADTIVARIEGGFRVGEGSVARIRVEALPADGLNLFVDLVAEIELSSAFGVQGFAGVSFSRSSGAGNHVGAGGFARWVIVPAVALRADAFVSAVVRNDFGGVGLGLVGGVEWRPRR